MSDAMTIDRKLEAVARAAWEADSAVAFAVGELAETASWTDQTSHVRESFRELVESCLRTELPNSAGLTRLEGMGIKRRQLFVGIVRCTAAALEMTIVYPGGVVRDWSQPQQKASP